MNSELLENLEKLIKMFVLLSEERKVVLSHHKTFEHVEKMRTILNESIDMVKNDGDLIYIICHKEEQQDNVVKSMTTDNCLLE